MNSKILLRTTFCSTLIFGLLATVSGCGSKSHAAGQFERDASGKVAISELPNCIEQLKDPNPTVRADAADAIREMRIHGDAAIPAIAPLIANFGDSDKKAREWAAEAFSCIHSDAVYQPLVETTKSKDNTIRAMGFYAIGSAPSSVKQAHSKELLAVLLGGLHDEDAEVRYYVANSFDKCGEIITAEAVPQIVEALKIDQPFFQCFLIRSLAHIGELGAPAIPALKNYCNNPNAEIAAVARITINRIEKAVSQNASKRAPAGQASSPETK
jgi:HEAT repeat protein